MQNKTENDPLQIQPRAEMLPSSLYEDPDADMVFGTINVQNIVVTTRCLGRTWGAQVLAVVRPEAVSKCSQCGELITEVSIGDRHFQCEVETRMDGTLFLANLIADHDHEEEEEEEEEDGEGADKCPPHECDQHLRYLDFLRQEIDPADVPETEVEL